MTRMVLLDRDGTINVWKGYLSSPEELELVPGAAQGIQLLRDVGMTVVLVTNQSGIARRYFDLDTLDNIHARLHSLLEAQGGGLDAIYFCPHHPDDRCGCRKPAPGLARKAADDLKCDLSSSFMVGDDASDIELGRRIGATTILVRTGKGSRVAQDGSAQPHYVVKDLLEAAYRIRKQVQEHN